MIREKASTTLTREGARRLTGRIRDALALADDLLVQAYEGRAWEAMGYATFADYCAGELPELRMLKMRVGPRRNRALRLHDVGATERDIAAATGASPATAHRDALAVTGRSASNEASAPTPPARKTECTQAAVFALVAASAGMTVHELCEMTGWNHGQVSGALSKLHQKKRIGRTGVFREGCGVYVATVSECTHSAR